MKENGWKINNTDLVLNCGLMEGNTMVNMNTIKNMEKDNLYGWMDQYMKVNLHIIM